MFRLFQSLIRSLVSLFQIHRALALENLALRQQVALLKPTPKRPRPSAADRLFWVTVLTEGSTPLRCSHTIPTDCRATAAIAG
jgi:hypothetical protein